MEEFLSKTVANLKSSYYSTLNLIIGNETCDLDSAVSSLVYACFLHWQLSQLKCGICKTADKIGHKDHVFVPVLNVGREDFQLKTEVELCLMETRINKEMLVFRTARLKTKPMVQLCRSQAKGALLLQSIKKSGNYVALNLVLGNESCDLDSAVSSLVFAGFLCWRHEQIKCTVCTRPTPGRKDLVFVPVLNVGREDFELKTEVDFCLRESGVGKEMLVFRNDYDLQELITKTKVNVVLVDHHTLATKDKFLAPHVTEIIDHRPIDKTEWNYRDDTRSTIEAVGSCCTLVAQRILDMSAVMGKKTDFFEAYPLCAQLLHSTIILDTVNFSKEVKKGTPHDLEIVSFLEGILKLDNPGTERECKLTRLLEARSDVSRLSAAQLLKKDVKIVKEVYIPSFPILVEEFLSRPGALPAVTEALQASGCSLALLLGMSLHSGLKRDAAICGNEPDRTAKLAQFLQDWTPSLQLTATDLTYPNTYYFNQLHLGASRKQYIPAVNAFLQAGSTASKLSSSS